MRTLPTSFALLALSAAPAFAQESGAAPASGGLMSIQPPLMFWTLVIFVILYLLLSRFAFGPITAAVEAREKALEEAIEGAKRDRDEAARMLEDQRKQIEAARGDAQKLIAEARAAGERVRTEMIDTTRKEQQDMIERARREIADERDKAILQLRREAVELAIAGATKVVEENLDSQKNRQLVESYLGSLSGLKVTQ